MKTINVNYVPPIRAMGIFDCKTWTHISTAAFTVGKAQTADAIISGMP